MKILQINKFFYLRGGTERYLFQLSELLEKNGHQVISFSMADSRNLPSKFSNFFAAKVNLESLNPVSILKLFRNGDAVRKLSALIEQEKPDIAHLHNIAHQLSPSIIRVLKDHKIPIVQTLHDYKLICPNYRLYSKNEFCTACKGGRYYQCFFRACMKGSRAKSFLAMLEAYIHQTVLKSYAAVDMFLAPSRFMAEICQSFGVPGEKIKVINNFTPLENLTGDNITESSPVISASVKFDKNDTFLTGFTHPVGNLTVPGGEYLLYFGRLSEEKGLDVLLAAAARLKEPIKIKLVGAGPSYQKYEEMVARYDLGGTVELMGPKYGDELKALLDGAAATLAPSIWPENMPMSVLESLAAGIPVIASRVGGLPEIIEDGVNGFLAHPGDAADLAEALRRFSSADKAVLGRNARNSAIKFSAKDHYAKILNIYESLTG